MTERVYRQDNLAVALERSRDTATLAWKGVSDNRYPGQFLNPIIDELVNELQNLEVTIDLRELEYMNSSTVTPLISLVKRLDVNSKLVRVLFLEVEWQRTHSNCMSAIARTLKNVRIERLSSV